MSSKSDVKQKITNAILLGDTLLYSATNKNTNTHTSNVREDAIEHKTELTRKQEQLKKELEKQYTVLATYDRDFIDSNNTLPEIQPKSFLNVIEDYTNVFLCISYLFMIVIFIYSYTMTSTIQTTGLLYSCLISVFITIIASLIFYWIA